MTRLLNFIRDDEAATAVEYAVLLALILLSVFGAIGSVGANTGGLWSNIQSNLRDFGLGG